MVSAVTILLAEDETPVRDLAQECLERAGFLVLPTANAQEALRALRRRLRIDMLITDVRMGEGMNGIDLAEQVVRERPGIKVLVMSGENAMSPEAANRGFSFLNKPFTLDELTGRVREILVSMPAASARLRRPA